MWCLSEFVRSLGDHEASSGQWKAPIPLHTKWPLLSLLCLSVSQSFIQLFVRPLPWARHSARLYHSGEQESSSNSSHGACSLETDVQSVSCWSAPRWLAWNRPSINIRWFANKDAHKLWWRKRTQCYENTVHIVSDQRACSFAMGQRWTHLGHFELELWILSFAVQPNFLGIWTAPVMRLNMRSPLGGTD